MVSHSKKTRFMKLSNIIAVLVQEISKPSDSQKCQFLGVGGTGRLIIDKLLKMR